MKVIKIEARGMPLSGFNYRLTIMGLQLYDAFQELVRRLYEGGD